MIISEILITKFRNPDHSIFGDRMANLGLIDFKIGLYIKVKAKQI